MKKLKQLNGELFNKHHLKTLLHYLKKGAQIGMMGAGLAAAPILGTGCFAEVYDVFGYDMLGREKDCHHRYPLYDGITPGNSGTNNPGTDPETPTIPSNKPSDHTVGNGNFNFHDFIGDTVFEGETAVEDINDYLDAAFNHVSSLAKKLNNSSQDRPAVADYFKPYITAMSGKYDYYYIIDPNEPGAHSFDNTVNLNPEKGAYIFQDIIKNMNNPADREAFIMCYKLLSTVAYGIGLGSYTDGVHEVQYANTMNNLAAQWNNNIALKTIDLTKDAANNYVEVTNLMDTLLGSTIDNFSKKYDGFNINDLRQVVNMALTNPTLQAFHDRTSNVLGHIYCAGFYDLAEIMKQAANTASINNQINADLVM